MPVVHCLIAAFFGVLDIALLWDVHPLLAIASAPFAASTAVFFVACARLPWASREAVTRTIVAAADPG